MRGWECGGTRRARLITDPADLAALRALRDLTPGYEDAVHVRTADSATFDVYPVDVAPEAVVAALEVVAGSFIH